MKKVIFIHILNVYIHKNKYSLSLFFLFFSLVFALLHYLFFKIPGGGGGKKNPPSISIYFEYTNIKIL